MTDLPQGWREVALGELCRVYQPKTISTKELIEDGEFVVFGANGVIGRYDKFNHEESEVTVTCRGATCGTVNVTTPKAWITGNAMVCQPNDKDISKTLLALLLKSVDFTPVITGTAQPQITRTSLSPLLVNVPPLAEQERIVEILEEQFSRLDSALASVKAVREKAKAFRRSLLHAAFTGELTGGTEGWTETSLADLCRGGKDGIVDGPFGSNLKRSDFIDSGIPVLKIQNIKQNEIVLKKMDYVSEEKYNQLSRHAYAEGDIIMTKLGDPLGISAIVSRIPSGLIVADLVRLRPAMVNSKFLCWQLNSPTTQHLLNSQQKGTTRPRVNLSMVRELRMLVPPLVAQELIVSILEEQFSKLDKALEVANQLEARIASERRSLLHSAFTGELTSQWRKTHV